VSTAAKFEILYYQCINEKGEPVTTLPAIAQEFDQLKSMYRVMVLTRTFDNQAILLQRTGRLGTFAPTLGQEAIGAALGHIMKKDDVLCPYYREYAAQIQRGVKLSEILAYWGGDERGNNFSENKNDFPISVPIGSQGLHAAGVGFSFKYRNEPHVAVTVCGDGATSEGDFYEAINFAGELKLPVVFVINNNQWAISIPRSHQTASQTLAQKAIAVGFEGIQVDGNDIIALCEVMGKALEKARTGGGPTLIEAVTYRLCDHTTADDANRYRDKDELKAAWEKEPVARLRNYLVKQQQWSKEEEEKLLAECKIAVDKEIADYLAIPPPTPESMFDYLYETLPEALIEQRQNAIEFSGSESHG
jgi:2-oxoisovalerate dehydrogenase E1 component alpha subunit